MSNSQEQQTLDTQPPALLPFAQLGLRLLGIMFVVDGVSAMFASVIQATFHAKDYADAGYQVPMDPHSMGWFASGVPHVIAGLYFIVGGNWVLLNVFAPAQRTNSTTREPSQPPMPM